MPAAFWVGEHIESLCAERYPHAPCVARSGVPEFLMGLVVLSVGTSVPDALSSILVARNGQA